MAKLSPEQLQVWYANLKTTLYEQLNIDLTRKEDLGRVRIIRINEWHYENPDEMPDVDMIYPFIPHRPLAQGEKSTDPLLSYYRYDSPAPDPKNMEAYQQWLLNNISATPTNELIQELYDMSSEGQLMAFNIYGEVHQVQNADGQISISEKYENTEKILPPVLVEPPKFRPDLPEKPQEPKAPKGFLLRLKHLFGIPNEYTEYVEKKEKYPEKLADWEAKCASIQKEWDESAAEREAQLPQQTEAYANYLKETAAYMDNPLARFHMAWNGSIQTIKNATNDMENEEVLLQQGEIGAFWCEQHKNTLQGNLQTEREKAEETLDALQDVMKCTRQMFDAKYEHNYEKGENGIFEKHTDVPSYEIPKTPNAQLSSKHASMICLAALAAPDVLAMDAPGDPLAVLDSQERYQKILDSFLLKVEEGSDPLFPYVREARAAGARAMQEYAQGNAQPLAEMLSNCIYRQNQMAAYLGDTYSLKSFGITAGLLEILDAHPDLMQHCTLPPEEMKQARANAAIFQMNEKALQAKTELLSHALYHKTLTPETLQNAAKDLLFLNTVNAQAAKKQDISALMSNPQSVQTAKDKMISPEALNNLAQMDRTELGKAAAVPQVFFAKIVQLNPDAQKTAPGKTIEQPQVQITQQKTTPVISG